MNIKALIDKCISGSRSDQKLLFDRFYSIGYHIARRYSSNAEDAKEILSNAYLRVFQKLDQYDPTRPFEAWFRRIIIHASSDFYRYAKAPFDELTDRHDEKTNHSVIDLLQYEELLECITRLSPKYRMVFNLYIIDGYKHHEIADLLKISVGTSKSNLSKAKIQLQKIIIEKYDIKIQNN